MLDIIFVLSIEKGNIGPHTTVVVYQYRHLAFGTAALSFMYVNALSTVIFLEGEKCCAYVSTYVII